MRSADYLEAAARKVREARNDLESARFLANEDVRARIAAELAVLERSGERIKHTQQTITGVTWGRFLRLMQKLR